MDISAAARAPADEVLAELGSAATGLLSVETDARLARVGPNAVRSHGARPMAVLARQVRSPLLVLLVLAAAVSFVVGERSSSVIIGVIVTLSIGLGFVNEYRAERAAEALHSRLSHRVEVRRDGEWTLAAVTALVPGDVVRLGLGSVVPADVRILSSTALECDEAVLTGESGPVFKDTAPVADAAELTGMSSCAFMGTIVRAGSAEAVVVSTGGATEFGRIALRLGERQEETQFQVGLRRFSGLLARVAAVLTGSILLINLVLQRPLLDALLFSLAIAVGITPQLLPAIVTTSLATGSRRLARFKVLVKRLVCIEDLGDVEVLLTDKTGTLTEGRLTFERAVDPSGVRSAVPLLLGLVCTEVTVRDEHAVGGNPLDLALWEAAGASHREASRYRQMAVLPFDHDRRRVSVLAARPDGRLLITKGAPEDVLALCRAVGNDASDVVAAQFRVGSRVVAVASRPARNLTTLTADDERDLTLAGFLIFLDQPKSSAASALARLSALGVTVRVLTGDNASVAEHVCDTLGLGGGGTLTGNQLDQLGDDALAARLATTRVYARMNPEQKQRIVSAYRHGGTGVAYLGDGVNDAVALHIADVGISVDSATDVAKDAADVVLLDKDLDVLANGVVEGRRIFANTIKYVLMGTSSNFGNMFSAAAASAFLPFLPMLPSQILLNNLLYDASQLAIPTDRVDTEQLARPSQWDIGFIRRFMLLFGPISSLFDFLTFAVMLNVFNAGPTLFRSGWFVESLATQCLIIFVIRTRRVPFPRSQAGRLLTAATLAAVAIGAILPASPLAAQLGFQPLPLGFFAILVALVIGYLILTEAAKYEFYAHLSEPVSTGARPIHERRVHRRAARFSLPGSPPSHPRSPTP